MGILLNKMFQSSSCVTLCEYSIHRKFTNKETELILRAS
jgi:hypothetical protein